MNVIILGSNHYNTLGLIWSLGKAGHRVILLLYNKGNNFVSKSKYINKTYLINRGDDIISLIKGIATEMDSRPIIFASNDVDATLLNEHFEELQAFCFFEGGRPDGSINRYRNKDEGERLAQKCGFVIPKTALIKNTEGMSTIDLPYPLLIKGNNSVYGGKAAMKKCNEPRESEEFVKGLPQDYFPLQVQEFIKKDFELMLLGCSLYSGKRIICPVANKKIRHYPRNTGAGSWSQSMAVASSKELRQLVSKVVLYMQEIEYTGNFSAEFLYANGKFYFLEINLRNDGTSWLSTCSGYNLPDMVCRSFVDNNVTADDCVFQQKHFMNIMLDVNYWIDGTVGLRQWLNQLRDNTCFSHYNIEDKEPWKYYNSHPLLTGIKIIIKKLVFAFKASFENANFLFCI